MVDSSKIRLWMAGLCLAAVSLPLSAQTFEVNKGQNAPADKKQNAAPGEGLGWGSSIEVARQARAAQDALQRGDYAAAANYAEHAAHAAPQNTELWFLLGYADRLADRYQASVDAYTRGLQNQPNSTRGLAGLAQTYARMGRNDEARQLLMRVVAANPRDIGTVQMAGELFLSSDPKQALDLLRRADSVQPSARSEILIARAYQMLNQPDQASEYLNRAKSRAPRDPEVLRAVAGQYRDSGHYDQAIATLQSIPGKNPDVQAELAYTYQLAGKKEQAAELYSRLARTAKGNVGLTLSAAQALVDLGQIESARQFLDQIQSSNANHYRLHAIRAQIALADSRIPDAVHEYQLAIQNLPPTPQEGPLYAIQLRLNLYELDQQVGNETEARQQLELATSQIQQVHVSDNAMPEFLRLRAAIEGAQGHTDAATKDLQQALALAPGNVNSMLNYATLLWKLGQKDEADKMFHKALDLDPKNRMALTSLGYLARDRGDTKQAANYFNRASRLYPKDFGPYLALGDLYASTRDFKEAETNYEAAYDRNPNHPLVIAGGANASLEAHNLELTKRWLDRAVGPMQESPQVMRERQRYLTWKGQYQEAAQLGTKVLEQLPRDRQAPVYLAYDLYYLGRYQEALDLATRYEPILPNNKDLALVAGYVHVRDGKLQDALADFTRALERDPTMSTGYANRGYVLNDLKQPTKSLQDFKKAIELRSDYGEAHLGLAYSYLQLHRPKPALQELDTAGKLLGESRIWHLGRAEAYRQEQKFPQAEKEYRTALQEVPNDLSTQLALADTLFRMRRYQEAIEAFQAGLKLSPDNPVIYAQMAQCYAKLGQRDQALHNIELAERFANHQATILMATGDALLATGDRDAAMQRFSSALEAQGGDRAGIRLAIAQIFLKENHWDDARRQIALGFAEARVGDSDPVTADDFVEAANIFLATHDFDLARTYFEKARLAGANPRVIAIGLANTYMAEGNNRQAELELASLGDAGEYQDDYDYLMTRANIYRQRQDTVHALSAFARASTLSGTDNEESAQIAQYELAGVEGRQLTQNFSVFPTASFAPVLEDINIYTLDAHLLNVTDPTLLPTPRHNYQSIGEAHYRAHLNGFPTIDGFVGERMTSGRFSFPSTDTIQDRHTYDTMFNGGISPVLRLGSATFSFNTGVQFTLRRDTISPLDMNQNLFRQYLYVSTNSFFNWVSVTAGAIHESGPFTERDLNSRDLAANLEFTVGRPWGRTALITGYTARDLLFRPLIREYYTTSSYAGLQRKFGNRLTVAVLAEYLRSWRVQDNNFAIAQALLPGGRFEFRATPRWNVQGSFTLSRGEGFHAYDNAQSEFLISYVRPFRGRLEDGKSEVAVAYPLKISFGLQQQNFYNFPGQSHNTLLPVVRFTLF
jgi:tetratricopeptide (TPR) repeat protein